MKIKYEFQDGEYVEIEVNENIGKVIIEMERKEKNIARSDRHHCTQYDGVEFKYSQLSSDKYSPENITENKYISPKLLAALEKLTPNQKKRFMMYVNGLKIKEIAKIEGINYSVANRSIKTAQKKLKEILKSC